MITYDNKNAKTINVLLDNKIVGTIHKVETGWQYKPKGSKMVGEIFAKLSELKSSLE